MSKPQKALSVTSLVFKIDALVKAETEGLSQEDRAWVIEGAVKNLAANLVITTIRVPSDGSKPTPEWLLAQIPKRCTELNEEVFDHVVRILREMKQVKQ